MINDNVFCCYYTCFSLNLLTTSTLCLTPPPLQGQPQLSKVIRLITNWICLLPCGGARTAAFEEQDREMFCDSSHLVAVVSRRQPLQLWVRPWGNVFWRDTERQRAAAAAHIVPPERSRREKRPRGTRISSWLVTWRGHREEAVQSHLSLWQKQSFAWQMLLRVSFSQCVLLCLC